MRTAPRSPRGLVRGVDLDLVADARDVDEQVARDRHHRDRPPCPGPGGRGSSCPSAACCRPCGRRSGCRSRGSSASAPCRRRRGRSRGSRSAPGPRRAGCRATSLTCSSTVAETAPAVARQISTPASSARRTSPRPTRGGGASSSLRQHRVRRVAHASPPSTTLSALGLPERGRQAEHEVPQRLAVARERGDRHPLLRPVVAGAGGAELDRRDAGAEERDRVGGAVAADAHRLALRRAARPRRTSAST